MLHLIKSLTDTFFNLLSEDPVRPHIPHTERLGKNKDVFVLRDEMDKVQAITCVSYQEYVPDTESGLFLSTNAPCIAVFYTIWSYAPGAGRKLIFDAVQHIKNENKEVTRFVTLSPRTELARRFHTKNGAVVYRENAETVNYEYTG
tara:strand:- start:1166 stop:1603 length:438 start_codon:yes stop_codon:yes gene_type:complete